jgi:hypothetical protein
LAERGRLLDAAQVLMREYGLNCVEAGHLLGLSVSEGGNGA